LGFPASPSFLHLQLRGKIDQTALEVAYENSKSAHLHHLTYEASLKLNPSDTLKVIFDNIDWSFIHRLVKERYKISPKGADGYDPISLFKAQLLIYLGEVSSDRKLASALRYNARLCLLCGFNFLRTPSNGTFTNFRDRLGEELFYEIFHIN
jgi:transposase